MPGGYFEIIFKHEICFKLITIINFYSVLKLFTGFATAAFIAWKLTVINAIPNVINMPKPKIHQLNDVL